MITHKDLEIIQFSVNNWDSKGIEEDFITGLENDDDFCKKYKICYNTEIVDQSLSYYISMPRHMVENNFPGLYDELKDRYYAERYPEYYPAWDCCNFGEIAFFD